MTSKVDIMRAPASLSRRVITLEDLDALLSELFLPFPSSSADDRLDLELLMPDSSTRTYCEFGVSKVDGG